jgi:transcriptional regulator with XRE-family HTH domain
VTPQEQLGANVRTRREALNLSQPALGERVRMQKSEISDIERGATNVRATTLVRLARGLECAPSSLLKDVALPD